MKQILLIRSGSIIAFLLVTNIFNFAQSAGNSLINEKSVRAQMQFLAGDAMQGRGSGTIFERIAAEYVGSEFMQFGLEPAGDLDTEGKPAFVQTINIEFASFVETPVLKFGNSTLEHSKQMLVINTTTGASKGNLQKLNFGDKPAAGSAAFIKRKEGDDPQKFFQGLQGLMSSGASIIIVEETPQWRNNWEAIGKQRFPFPISNKPTVLIVVNKEAEAELSALPDGTNIEFVGKTIPSQKQQAWNAVGKITGSDKKLAAEVILLTSHLDHLGVRETLKGDDKIFNGADDNASGTVAVLELARILGNGNKPKRTVYFVCYGSEEKGLLGSRYFAENLPFPKDKLVANLNFEMIGRSDSKVKPGELWLTGFERSNLGIALTKRGAKLVQDPRPEQSFFLRSDNATLALSGVIAHTVSSFGLHSDYHKVSDEVKTINLIHLTRSINSMIEPLRWPTNSDYKPAWNPSGKP